MLRSSKNANQRKQWWYRVAGYSAVAPHQDPSTNLIQLTLTLKMTTAQVVETSVPVSNSHFRTTLTRTITLHLATYATICKAWLWQEEQGLGGLYQNEHSPNLAFITWLSLRLKAVIIITVYKYHNIWVLLVESAWSLELAVWGKRKTPLSNDLGDK